MTKKPKVETKEVEEFLPLELIEQENKDDPKAVRIKIPLGTKLLLKPPAKVTFDKSQPPRAEVEWQLDAAILAAAAKIDLDDLKYKGKKWEIGETKDDSEWKFQLKIPVDKREGKLEKFHLSNKVPLKIIKKPIRVLLMAAAANRDYQFVRSLLVRETEKKRIELAIHLQLPPGRMKWTSGVVQDVPPERLLTAFPDTLGKKKDLSDLQSYDVIVAFDPDWNRLTAEQIRMVSRWANKGGGLVMIGGYINTVELIKPREGDDAARYQPIIDLLPVVLADRRRTADRKAETPWPLEFEGASPEMEFLRLDETLDASKFKEDWQAFFYGMGKDKTEKAQRGFFSFYPVEKVKTGSLVVARFLDPEAKLRDNTFHPYIVMSPDTLARVIWIGSAETWRLRQFREAYHERFWTKLVRFAGSKSKGGARRGIRPEMNRTYVAEIPTAWLLLVPIAGPLYWMWKWAAGAEKATGLSGITVFLLMWLVPFVGIPVMVSKFNAAAAPAKAQVRLAA